MSTAPKQYRKKPIVVEVMQWPGSAQDATPVINWMLDHGVSAGYSCAGPHQCAQDVHTISIPTLEGTMHASPGDYIIKGVQDEFYPCKPDIFAETYEAAE